MYYIGETKRIVAQFVDEKGSLLSPTSVKIQIKNSAGIQLSFRNMTLDATGNFYYYDWTIPNGSDLGDYTAITKGVFGSFVSFGNEVFKVSENIDSRVWKAQLIDNMVVGSLGEAISRVLGLTQQNIRLSNHVYDDAKNLLSSTIAIFRNANDVDSNTNPIATYLMTASYDSNNRLSNYKFTEQ